MILPLPLQTGHTPVELNCPNGVRCTCVTRPVPLHWVQVLKDLPSFAPVPLQSEQTSILRTLMFLRVPKAASSKVSVSPTRMSVPLCGAFARED